jgi:hypothetical protein
MSRNCESEILFSLAASGSTELSVLRVPVPVLVPVPALLVVLLVQACTGTVLVLPRGPLGMFHTCQCHFFHGFWFVYTVTLKMMSKMAKSCETVKVMDECV